jgi:ABC-type sulfate/molybdate transport systems ATPase subunit
MTCGDMIIPATVIDRSGLPRRPRIELADRVLTSTSLPVSAVPPRVGLLRQNPGRFPHLSVRDGLCYAPTAFALGSRTVVPDLGARHRQPAVRVLLLNEPYTGLDASLRRTLSDLVSSLVAEDSIPAVLVTHGRADAQAFADHLAILDRGELLQIGAPDEAVLRPASRRVAELIGNFGFVPTGIAIAGMHPERIIAGASADPGLVVTGVSVTSRLLPVTRSPLQC